MRFRHRRLGDVATIDFRQVICQEAQRQGVPAGIALAVAMKESGIRQWDQSGNLIIGDRDQPEPSIGLFQVKQSSAPGVDLTDPIHNIQAGIGYLARMYQSFGNWQLALSAFNWGPGNVNKKLTAGLGFSSFPSSVRSYATQVLAGSLTMQCLTFFSQTSAQPAVPDVSGDPSTDVQIMDVSPASPVAVLVAAGVVMLAANFFFD